MSAAGTIRCANWANTNSRELGLTRLTHANTILPLKVPLKMISLRLPSRMINSDRTHIRLLGQEHNHGDSPSVDYLE